MKRISRRTNVPLEIRQHIKLKLHLQIEDNRTNLTPPEGITHLKY